eukprot:XP_001695377.1 predicted protein [Chlamydomonas reinhardtii]
MSPAQASEPDAAGSQPTQLLAMPTWARRNSNPSPPRDDNGERPQEKVQDQPQPQPPLHQQHPTGRHRRASGVLAEAAAAVAAAHTPSVAALRALNASRRRSVDLGYGPGGFTAPVSPALSQAGTGEPSSTSMGSHAGAAGAPATRPALRQSGCLSIRVPHSPSLQSLGGESENGSGPTPPSSAAGGLPPGACSSPLTGRTTTARTITFAQERPRGSSMSPAGSQRNFDAVVNSLWEKELEKGWQASSKHSGLLVGTRAPLRSLVAAGALGGKSFSGGSAGSLTAPPPPGAPSLAAAGMLGVAALGGPSGSATMAAREVLVGDRLAGGSAGGSSVQRPCSNRVSARSRRSLDHASQPIALAGGSNAGTPTGHNPRRSLDEGFLAPGARMSLTSVPPPPGAFAATRVAAGSPLPVHVHGPLTPTPPSSSPVLAKAAGAAGAGAAGVTAARRPAKRVGVFRKLLGVLHAVQHETAAELEEPTAQD